MVVGSCKYGGCGCWRGSEGVVEEHRRREFYMARFRSSHTPVDSNERQYYSQRMMKACASSQP